MRFAAVFWFCMPMPQSMKGSPKKTKKPILWKDNIADLYPVPRAGVKSCPQKLYACTALTGCPEAPHLTECKLHFGFHLKPVYLCVTHKGTPKFFCDSEAKPHFGCHNLIYNFTKGLVAGRGKGPAQFVPAIAKFWTSLPIFPSFIADNGYLLRPTKDVDAVAFPDVNNAVSSLPSPRYSSDEEEEEDEEEEKDDGKNKKTKKKTTEEKKKTTEEKKKKAPAPGVMEVTKSSALVPEGRASSVAHINVQNAVKEAFDPVRDPPPESRHTRIEEALKSKENPMVKIPKNRAVSAKMFNGKTVVTFLQQGESNKPPQKGSKEPAMSILNAAFEMELTI